MSSKRYTEEFTIEAVKQVTDRGFTIREVAERLGITPTSLSAWIKKYGQGPERAAKVDYQQAEINRLRKELKRVTEERDILKKATVSSAGQGNTSWNFSAGERKSNIFRGP